MALPPKRAGGSHPGDNPEANLKSISHRCHPILVAFVWEFTEETIHLPLGCLQGGEGLGLRVQGLGYRVQGTEFRVQGSGFRVQGLGFGV